MESSRELLGLQGLFDTISHVPGSEADKWAMAKRRRFIDASRQFDFGREYEEEDDFLPRHLYQDKFGI